ncbi:MAG: PD40 domain-containing protein [Niabella sp.]|nr:PD40 domain-containing protein [Niabella sp.]
MTPGVKILFFILVAASFCSCKKTDIKSNKSATDTVKVTLINPGPTARAGKDTTIIIPASTAILDGRGSTDPQNDITNYKWAEIVDGTSPASFNIVNPNAAQTPVTNLVDGTYRFELKVTDASGIASKDTVQVTVLAKTNSGKIVFVSGRDGNLEIYSCDSNGANVIRLTNNPETDLEPSWSPDGTHIAFISYRNGSPGLYIMNADGSNVVHLASGSFFYQPTWSPDGTKIAYEASTSLGVGIWIAGTLANGPSPALFLADTDDGDYESPAWSPDGGKIAFVYTNKTVGSDDIYLINPDGSGYAAITVWQRFLYPAWSPDGTKLSVTHEDQDLSPITVINRDGSGGISINPPGISGQAPSFTRTSWSPDGTMLLYSSWTGTNWNVAWISVDGKTSGTIVTNGWDADWHR